LELDLDVRLPNATGPELGFFVSPQAETAKGYEDSLAPQHFPSTIKAKAISGLQSEELLRSQSECVPVEEKVNSPHPPSLGKA
jgi:hypothetical protein